MLQLYPIFSWKKLAATMGQLNSDWIIPVRNRLISRTSLITYWPFVVLAFFRILPCNIIIKATFTGMPVITIPSVKIPNIISWASTIVGLELQTIGKNLSVTCLVFHLLPCDICDIFFSDLSFLFLTAWIWFLVPIRERKLVPWWLND